jgi:hypothetical protein
VSDPDEEDEALVAACIAACARTFDAWFVDLPPAVREDVERYDLRTKMLTIAARAARTGAALGTGLDLPQENDATVLH